MENLLKMDDLGVPLFLETPIYIQSYLLRNLFFFFGGVYFLVGSLVTLMNDQQLTILLGFNSITIYKVDRIPVINGVT